MEEKVGGLKHQFKNTYSVIRDFVLRVNHATVCKSRSAEQVLFLFFPPLFVCLSDEEGWDPI